MSSPSQLNHGESPPATTDRELAELRSLLDSRTSPSELDDHDVQLLLGTAVKLYAGRRQEGRELAALAPEQTAGAVTATEGVVAALGILEAVSVEIFELGLWKALGRA